MSDPLPADAPAFAKIRWMANALENVALQMYVRGVVSKDRRPVMDEIAKAFADAVIAIENVNAASVVQTCNQPGFCWDGKNCYPCVPFGSGGHKPFSEVVALRNRERKKRNRKP